MNKNKNQTKEVSSVKTTAWVIAATSVLAIGAVALIAAGTVGTTGIGDLVVTFSQQIFAGVR